MYTFNWMLLCLLFWVNFKGGGNVTCEDALDLVLNLDLPLQSPLPTALEAYNNYATMGTKGDLVKVLCDNPGLFLILLSASTHSGHKK